MTIDDTLYISPNEYHTFSLKNETQIMIKDHVGGFNETMHNKIFDQISSHFKEQINIHLEFIVDYRIKLNYPNFNFNFNLPMFLKNNYLLDFKKYKQNINQVKLENFVCSFNGSDHISRRLLTAGLYKFKWFDNIYCSKNFVYSIDQLDGYISSVLTKDQEPVYRKFLIVDELTDDSFYTTINRFSYTPYNHIHNLSVLSNKISSSFVHLVSETIGTSYQPFVTEKPLYSIVNNGLWLAFAQPNYHNYLEMYFGFKKYNKIFDYTFDSIENPVLRLVELLSMLSKFEKLSKLDWHDLYLIENDTIQYNKDWFFSNKYQSFLEQTTNVSYL
jgi:hypothetical protein